MSDEARRNAEGELILEFTFTVPKDSPTEAGVKKTGSFTYLDAKNDHEAAQTIKTESSKQAAGGGPAKGANGWRLTSLVNQKLFDMARAAAYQKALTPYRPTTLSPEQMQEAAVTTLIRIGIPEAKARETVMGLQTQQVEAVSQSA